MKVIRVIMKSCMAHVKFILRNYNLLAAYIIDQHCVFKTKLHIYLKLNIEKREILRSVIKTEILQKLVKVCTLSYTLKRSVEFQL